MPLPSGPFTGSLKKERIPARLARCARTCGHGAANRGRMHADFFGDLLDHHGFRASGPYREIHLAGDDGLADAQNGVFAAARCFFIN